MSILEIEEKGTMFDVLGVILCKVKVDMDTHDFEEQPLDFNHIVYIISNKTSKVYSILLTVYEGICYSGYCRSSTGKYTINELKDIYVDDIFKIPNLIQPTKDIELKLENIESTSDTVVNELYTVSGDGGGDEYYPSGYVHFNTSLLGMEHNEEYHDSVNYYKENIEDYI